MTYTKEQLEQALAFIKAKESQDYMSPEDYYHIWKYHGETIKSLIQDALDPWNYNMDEAPRDEVVMVTDGASKFVSAIFAEEYEGDGYYWSTCTTVSDLTFIPTAWQHLPAVSKAGVVSKITKENEK